MPGNTQRKFNHFGGAKDNAPGFAERRDEGTFGFPGQTGNIHVRAGMGRQSVEEKEILHGDRKTHQRTQVNPTGQ